MNYEDYIATLDPKVAKRLKTAAEVENIRLPLVSAGLTHALGGGIGAGRVTLTYGNTSSGKSALFQQTIGEIWQPMGLTCAYVDVEGTWDSEWAARLRVNNKELVFASSRSAGRIEEEIKPHLLAGIDVIVIDSISDIMPEVFVDSKTGDLNEFDKRKQTGAHAKACTQLVNGIHYLNDRTAVVLISQTTTEIGQTYVKQIPHGGKKVLFGSSQIIKLTSSSTEPNQYKGEVQLGDRIVERPIGREVEWFVEKNKMGQQHGKGTYDLYYAGDKVGIDTIGEVFNMAEEFGVIEKSGTWYTYDGTQYQGKRKVIAALSEDEGMLSKMKDRLHTAMTGEIREN